MYLINILITDDDASSLEMIAMFLERQGDRAHTTSNGLDAWHLAQELKPDIIVLDASMPGLVGSEVAQRVREPPALCECRLFALIGHDANDAQQQNLFDQHFTKPASPNALLASIHTAGSGPRLAA